MKERIVESAPVWHNARTCPPPSGVTVLALTYGGVLISINWSAKALDYCVGWMAYPRVTPELKKILSDKWKIKGETQ